MTISVHDLLTVPFLSRSRYEQIHIIRLGKPRPCLPLLTRIVSQNSRRAALKGTLIKQTLNFDLNYYENVNWLTGCDMRHCLFCWYCVLFGSEDELWAKTGFNNLPQLDLTISHHSKCAGHLQCALNFSVFLQELGDYDLDLPSAVPTADAWLRKRELVRRLIDVICFSVFEINPKTGVQERRNLVVRNSMQNLRFYRDYDILNVDIVDEVIEMVQATPKIVDDMIEAIKVVATRIIANEVQQSSFVSLILNEHFRIQSQLQISVVIRYLKNGTVCERFLGFCDLNLKKVSESAKMVASCVNQIINNFQISKNVVGISANGTALSRDLRSAFRDYLIKLYQQIIVVPCHFHELSHVLRQSLSLIKELDILFKHLRLLSSYFWVGSEVWEHYQTFLAGSGEKTDNFLDLPELDFVISVEYFEAVKMHRRTLVLFLESILKSNQNQTTLQMSDVHSLYSFLVNIETFFLLEVMSSLLNIMHYPNDESREDQNLETTFNTERMMSTEKYLNRQIYLIPRKEPNENTFEIIWKEVVDLYNKGERTVRFNDGVSESQKSYYQKLYMVILKSAAAEVRYQIACGQKLQFFSMLNFKEKGTQLAGGNVSKLITIYNQCHYFDVRVLKLEITELQEKSAMSSCENAQDVIDVLTKCELKHRFPNVYKLAELVLTMPCTVPNSGDTLAKLNDVQRWSYKFYFESYLDNLSFISVERDFLNEQRMNEDFYNTVMVTFGEKNDCLKPY